MKIPVTRTDSTHSLPAMAHFGDAGADLSAAVNIDISPGERVLVATGIAVAIPEGFAGFVLPRSGLAVNFGVTIINAPGLIDSGYRGELKVGVVNHGSETFSIGKGDRIAQLVIMAVASPEFVEVDNLDATPRGDGGFGSTGGTAVGTELG